jgi:RNA polymerase sigma-70 factor (ECF subfamily)
LCAWFAGNREAAEDLAQETLIAAWRSREQLTSLDKWKPWTSAIARNVCLNWSRQHYREQSRVDQSIDLDHEPNDFPDETDLELELDRHELARLLDRALAQLSAETAQMLVAHYIQDSSHAEIAEIMRMNPGTVAVRLQRGKLTLRKVLQNQLQPEASAFELMPRNKPAWEETNIWCPSCGESRLMGKFHENEIFALRCPRCDSNPESIMAGLDLSKPYHADLLGKIKTYKPAYSRLLTAFLPLYRQALDAQFTPCLACSRPIQVSVGYDRQTSKYAEPVHQIRLHCPACDWASNKSLAGFVIGSPEVQRFWRNYPRMRTLPVQEIEVQGSPALLTRLQSVTDNAELVVLSRGDTFAPIGTHTNVKL